MSRHHWGQKGYWTGLVIVLSGTLFAGSLFLLRDTLASSSSSASLTSENSEGESRVELSEILDGGPPKDGIPSIDRPVFDSAETTPFKTDSLVIGMVINGEAKAYPLGIMDWHEIVNDQLGGRNITVSYCPLCDTIVAFDRGKTTFGVSGKLFQSCLVMYERGNDSLYVQPWGLGVQGESIHQSLERIPTIKTTLGAWLAEHPESKVLSDKTGHVRDYFNYPYGEYRENEQIFFPVRHQEEREIHPKQIVSYVWEANGERPKNQFGGESLQVVHDDIAKIDSQEMAFNGRKIRVRWHPEFKTVIAEELDGSVIPSSTAYGFV